MKLIVEIDINGEIFKPDAGKDSKIRVLNNVICSKLNDLVLEATLDHREYIPDHKGKRWIDYIGDIRAIDIK